MRENRKLIESLVNSHQSSLKGLIPEGKFVCGTDPVMNRSLVRENSLLCSTWKRNQRAHHLVGNNGRLWVGARAERGLPPKRFAVRQFVALCAADVYRLWQGLHGPLAWSSAQWDIHSGELAVRAASSKWVVMSDEVSSEVLANHVVRLLKNFDWLRATCRSGRKRHPCENKLLKCPFWQRSVRRVFLCRWARMCSSSKSDLNDVFVLHDVIFFSSFWR